MSGDLQLLPCDLGAGVRAVFSTRVGGVGGPGHGDTNLSLRSADEASRTLANRDLLARALSLTEPDLVFAEQVHGAEVALVEQADSRAGRAGLPGVDALVTRQHGVGLVAFAADCMPVLLADPTAGVVAAAHSGRPGLVAGVLSATVAVMVGQGAAADAITAVVGPCIGGCCYELPEQLADAVAAVVPAARSTTTWGTPSIDLRSGADAVLAAAGVRDVRHLGACTREQPETFYSYRRDGTADRHGGLIVLG